ncbi:MAG: RdgB/HAM1 family non-canonical purine NTP pyrophosphatase [Propionibacteriaceae bacterium]|nr:RdgB/HAM1 family non-canonical purine NTP pyrophosphatase [Propionibacteriaceae bacterium]
MRKVVLATHNLKKQVELQRIFDAAALAAQVVTLEDFPPYLEPVEDQRTFEQNALLKARAAAAATGELAIADDSGIEVELLNNMPGVRSARWAGVGASDAANLNLLIAQLADTEVEQRSAQFVAAMAMVSPSGFEAVHRGVMCGHVILTPRGENGFGYDPIFVATAQPAPGGRTNAELTAEEKDAISHRGKAAATLIETLRIHLE